MVYLFVYLCFMKVSEQIKKATTSTEDSPRKFSKSFVSSLLEMSRKTFYDRMDKDDFNANEIKILKDNKIIN